MIKLSESLSAWKTPQFNAVLKHELEEVPVDQLPLLRCLKMGSYVLDDKPSVLIQSVTDSGEVVRVKIGVVFSSSVAGYSCDADPAPVDVINEYCELWLALDKQTGEGEVSLAD